VQLCCKNTLFFYQSRKPSWPLLQPPTFIIMSCVNLHIINITKMFLKMSRLHYNYNVIMK
jgi:hypothetical protein